MDELEARREAIELMRREGDRALSIATRLLLDAFRRSDQQQVAFFRRIIELIYEMERARRGANMA